MRVYSLLIIMTVFLAATISRASAGGKDGEGIASQKDQAIKFLKTYLIGKTFKFPESSVKLDNGKIETQYSGTFVLSNLVETSNGFMFDSTSISKQMNYDLTKDGKRILPGRDEGSVDTYRYEIDQRKSTGKLIGINRSLTTTSRSLVTTGNTTAVRIEVRKGLLEMTEASLLYDDFFAEKGKYKPGAAQSVTRFLVQDGKLQGEIVTTMFDVDPQTFKRTPKSDPPIKDILTLEQ